LAVIEEGKAYEDLLEHTVEIEFTPVLHKQHDKRQLKVRYYNKFHSEDTIFWISQTVNSKDEVDFAMLFTLRESRRTSDPVLSRDQGNQLRFHP
jgi:hypothetical protein